MTSKHLNADSSRSRLLAHSIVSRVRSKEWSVAEISAIVGQYWYPLHFFPTFLGRLLSVAPDTKMKTAISKILNQELGDGRYSSSHEWLYIQAMCSLGIDKQIVCKSPMTPQTEALVNGYSRASENFYPGIGFLTATETTDLDIVKGLEGVVSKLSGNRPLPWVTIHTLQEPEHIDLSTSVISDAGISSEAAKEIKNAMAQTWTLWLKFFNQF